MSDSITDGGPAFPQQAFINTNGQVVTADDYFPDASGMSLRDWFAGMALQGIASIKEDRPTVLRASTIALDCYHIADAMLVARQAKEESP